MSHNHTIEYVRTQPRTEQRKRKSKVGESATGSSRVLLYPEISCLDGTLAHIDHNSIQMVTAIYSVTYCYI
jgi:hypothetical protein